MSKNVAELTAYPAFESFVSEASHYLMQIHDRPARIFGVRYLQYLENARTSAPQTARRPRVESPAQFLVKLELKRIFERHFGTRTHCQL
jgi:hypothetical protein